LNLVQWCQVEVEHHALAADFVDFILDYSYFHCSGSVRFILCPAF